ncbi:MAG: protein kinase, partial [Chloroflexi bacterium]|nr:protein kinase [Chloroflexota bacterium]
MDNLSGQTIGKYKIFSRLGVGGMARVYKAYQANLDRYVAVKVMHAYLAEEEEFIARFKREAAAIARLRHPNIIQVHDFDVRNDDLYYMVMEFIEGPTLKAELDVRVLQDEPFSLIEITHIISRLARAIDYAHVRGMVHRDIKPANIMFTSDGQIILTDFGIVRMIGFTYNTNTGFLAGTPAYMSPEQGRGKHGDERSDIYSLGIILYELLTGRPPFNADTPLALIKQHIESQMPPPTTFNPNISPEIETILDTALAKNPEYRFQRASELALALQSATGLSASEMLYPPPTKTVASATEETESITPLTPAYTLDKLDTAVQSSPYRGLFAFKEQDAPFFFGRESFTERLITAVQEKSMVAVIGPSGSGKSSVVQAGLIPQLRQEEGWLLLSMRPGSKPFQSIASALVPQLEPTLSETGQIQQTSKFARKLREGRTTLHEIITKLLAKQKELNETDKLLLFVDQFEEIYTLCADANVRQSFLDALVDLVDIQQFNTEANFTLVLTLRTDFLGQALHYRPLSDALQNADIKLGPMNRRELSRAVASPARRQGLKFETGLVARILDDVGNEPGNLPLLEFALTSLWDNRDKRNLSHEAYESIGEVEGALARHADDIYNQLSTDEKEQAHRIFIQMVRPGAGTEDTRRLATREELGEENWRLVQKLAGARLVVTSRDPTGNETVEVVHEALIRGWRRLRQWMSDDRNFRAWQERLRAAQTQWSLSNHDDGALLRGLPLTEAESWLADRELYLSILELDFIQASITARDAEIEAQEQAAEAQRRMKEQERAERQRAEENERRAEESVRYAKRLSRLALALVVVLILAIIAAFSSAQNGSRAANNAATAVANEQTAINAQETAVAALAESEINLNLVATAERVAAERAAAQEQSAIDADNARATAVAAAAELETALDDAEESAEIAVSARNDAEQQSRLSTSRQLAAAALEQLESDPQLALLLALESTNIT